MLIRMYEHKAVMEAGIERMFDAGVSYDVPPVIGAQWVEKGMAAPVVPDTEATVRDVKAKAGKGRASA